jgi:hypothetical protein
VLRLFIQIGGDSLTLDGDVTLEAVLPVIHDWYAELPKAEQRRIDQLTARVGASNTKLAGDVDGASHTTLNISK